MRVFSSARELCRWIALLTPLAVLGGQWLLTPAVASAGDLVVSKKARVAIVTTTADLSAPAQLAVEDLLSHLQRTLQVVARRYQPDVKISGLEEDAVVIVGASGDAGFAPLVAQFGKAVSTEKLGDEGGRIVTAAVSKKTVVVLAGKTWTGACHAVYSFLEQELGVGFFIDGDRVPELESVDLSGIDRSEVPRVAIRGLFYHPTWIHPHANCARLWSFKEWERYLDWMRHRRMNVVLLFHDDGGYSWGDAIFEAFPQVKKNDKTLEHFVTDPTWRTELNKKIISYARESGLKIAFNLFYSQIPEFVAESYPKLETHPLRMRNVGIRYTQPECKEIMRKYWGTILKKYGIDDSHLYIICSYKHEVPLPDYVASRNAPTKDAIALLRELDPAAKIFVETWCWNYLQEPKKPMSRQQWLDDSAVIEWKNFNTEMPKDIGVADWDRKQEPQRVPDPTFGGRPYIQLTHSTMESWWPPDTVRRHPRFLLEYFGDAISKGAQGILTFHIHASTNPILADLTAEVGWKDPPLADYYRDYARRRFGSSAGEIMAECLANFCDAVDMHPAEQGKPVYGSLDDMSNFLAFPGFGRSAEELLYRARSLKEKRPEWIKQRLEWMQPKAAKAARAAMLARAVAPQFTDDPFFDDLLWQVDYISARVAGIEGLYGSYLTREGDVAGTRRLYDRALSSFASVRDLFRGKQRYEMAQLQNIEPDVPYIKSYLDNWEFRGALDKDTFTYHVIWERIPKFEDFLWSLQPAQLGPPKKSALDARPWFEIVE